MSPTDRFVVYHREQGPVYSSDLIPRVIGYLWGRDVSQHWVLAYEVPVTIESADLDAFGRKLYGVLCDLVDPMIGTDTPVL